MFSSVFAMLGILKKEQAGEKSTLQLLGAALK